MAERFYVNCPLARGPVVVEGAEAHHLATVCRLRPGDEVCLFNGNGLQFPARILETGRRRVTLEVQAAEAPYIELRYALEVAAPLPKGERAAWLLEKLTELGVTAFIPLQTDRSVVHPRDTKLDRLQRTVIEASKQCGRNRLLQVRPLESWQSYCQSPDLSLMKIVAHPRGLEIGEKMKRCEAVTIAVGPEGGFTEEEIDRARSAGWQVVGLGRRILRVETAAIVLATLFAQNLD
jgi:16S rRNA (uracil1498-N3)-methyltransferase